MRSQGLNSDSWLIRWYPTFPLVIFSLLLIVILADPLKSDEAPLGIVSFQFAATTQKVSDILKSWTSSQREIFERSIWWDIFLFIPVYATLLCIGCSTASRLLRAQQSRYTLGFPAWWIGVLAALFDWVEDAVTEWMLRVGVTDPWPLVMGICASLKFLLIFVGAGYMVVGLVAWRNWRRRAAGSRG